MRTPKIAILTLAAAVSLLGCQGDPKESEAYKQLAQEHEQGMKDLQQQMAQKDSAMNLVLGSFARVSDNLRNIRTKQSELIGPAPNVEAGELEEHMMADIQHIDGLLAENKKLIARLRNEAKASAEKMADLERAIVALEQQMTEKDIEITELKKRLVASNQQLGRLMHMYKGQARIAALQQAELNTAYYVVGSAKDLRKNGVLTKEGGIVGIGATDKLQSEGLNMGYFTKIDLSTTSEIPFNGKKVRLATPHPEGSYSLGGEDGKLLINDREEFWSLSKYLVVVVVS